jgi:type II secretory pathway pseudopilin PulG
MQQRLPARKYGLRRKHDEGGYILITLMLFVSLLVIASLVAVQTLSFEVQRDREEELVHRGVQYARAVRKYYKKFGTYPATLDALENTQNMKFLRRRYKDPVTNQDFKILRMTDVRMMVGTTGIAGAQTLGGGLNGVLAQTGLNQAQAAAYVATQASIGANNANPFANASTDSSGQVPDQSSGAGGTPANPNSPTSANSPGTGQPGQPGNATSNSPFVSANGQSTGGTFGGAPIVGVVSTSKKETIRVFAKKNHYNDWQFIYDPNSDRGGLLNSPVQPNLQQGLTMPTQNGIGQNSSQSGTSSPFSNSFGNNQSGSGNSFGSNSGNSFGNSGNSFGNSNNGNNSPQN